MTGHTRGRRGAVMTFEEVVDQALAMLQRRGRVTYRMLQRHFQLDDAALQDLKDELLCGQRMAGDEEGRVLVWMGDPTVAALRPLDAPPHQTAARHASPSPTRHRIWRRKSSLG